MNPHKIEINAALPEKLHPNTFDKTIGTKAAPSAVHANTTQEAQNVLDHFKQ